MDKSNSKALSPMGKRVGASVIPDGIVGPYPNAMNPAYGPYPGVNPIVGPGCGPYGCLPPFYPPPVPFFNGIIFDDRLRRCDSDSSSSSDDEDDVALTASVAPQSVAAASTAPVQLLSAMSSVGCARISGNYIILPRRGRYSISVNITVARSNTSAGGNVSFLLNGGTSNSGVIASSNVPTDSTQVISGTTTFTSAGRRSRISVLVNNAGGPLSILGGTITVTRNCH